MGSGDLATDGRGVRVAAVWALARARLRGRWRALLGLTLLVGVAAGAVMTAAIGARRTETAYPRLLEATLAADVHVGVGSYTEEHPGFVDELRRLPQVADLGLASVAFLVPDEGLPTTFAGIAPLMSTDGRFGWTVDRPLIVAGRRPDPGRAEEVALSETLASRWRVRPGDSIRLRALTWKQAEQTLAGELVIPTGPAFTLQVVAIGRLPVDVSTVYQDVQGSLLLTPAFYRHHKDEIAHFPAEPHVRLRRGWADLEAFDTATRRLARQASEVGPQAQKELAANVGQATRIESIALGLFALLAALAALVMIGQTMARELFLATRDGGTLWALGVARSRHFVAVMLPVGLVGLAGGLAGAGLAVLASPMTPMGLARRAEPDPGPVVHLAGLGIGVAVCLVLVVAVAAVPAWRLARTRPEATDPPGQAGAAPGLAEWTARVGLPVSSVTGLRMALERGRGATTVPVRTTVVGVTAGIVALTAALTFTASLDHLLETPRLYGWSFDAVTGDWDLTDPSSRRPPQLAANPHIGAFSAVHFHQLQVAGAAVYSAAIDTAHGHVFPTTIEGREPRGPDEITLGTRTLRELGLRLGQIVEVRARRTATMRIVGRSAGLAGETNTAAATGGILTLEGLRRLDPDPTDGYGVFYVRYAPGADPAAARRSLQRSPSGAELNVMFPEPPTDVRNLGRVGGLPGVLAGLLAVLAASTLAHLLVTSVRRRRRDLAVLKTLGFVRRQISATVAWQATTVALIALAVGLPLGVALGRWTWSLLIDRIGLGAEPVTPWPVLLDAATATVLVANLVAAWPGRMAARTRPALALRSE
jgi:ABC-type lipoprotein release transport system permease subunit